MCKDTYCSAFTLQSLGLCPKTTQIACSWHWSPKCIRKHVFGMRYEHFVCVCKDTCTKHRKTCENTLCCVYTPNTRLMHKKTRKLHVFDICCQSASENTFLDWNMTISWVCKNSCTKHIKNLVYAEKTKHIACFWQCSQETCTKCPKTCENTLFCLYTPNTQFMHKTT